jgi:hypothetical protein
MTDEERKRAIEELANSIVNNMSMAEMMAVVVEKAKYLAQQRVNEAYLSPKNLKAEGLTGQVERSKLEGPEIPEWRKKTFRKKIRALWRERSILWKKIKSRFSRFFLPKWIKLKKLFSKRHKNFKTK